MKQASQDIVLRVDTPDKQDFINNYKDAVLGTFMLLFERRELDLCEDQLYSLSLLAQSARAIGLQVSGRKGRGGD